MRVAALLYALGFLATVIGPEPIGPPHDSDLPVYAFYADQMLGGELPYRDFAFEYPPLAAPLLALGGVAGMGHYELVFGVIAFVLGGVVVALTGELAARTGADRRTGLIAAAVVVPLCGALIRNRFDLAPVALMLAALVLMCRERPRLGLAVLGAGALTKGFPLVVVPVALAWLLARGERRAAAEGAVALAATVLVIGGAAAALSADGFADSLKYHLDRPAQVESSPAVVLTGLEVLGEGHAVTEESFGSAGVRHPDSGLVLGLFTALLAGGLVLVVGAVTVRRPPAPRQLVLASLAAVVLFAALGKVFSPQFMIWVAPLTALAAAWRMYPLCACLVAAHLLTLLDYPFLYDDLAAGDQWASGIVGLRNAALVAAVALVVRELVSPAREAAGPRWPDRLRRPRPAPR